MSKTQLFISCLTFPEPQILHSSFLIPNSKFFIRGCKDNAFYRDMKIYLLFFEKNHGDLRFSDEEDNFIIN